MFPPIKRSKNDGEKLRVTGRNCSNETSMKALAAKYFLSVSAIRKSFVRNESTGVAEIQPLFFSAPTLFCAVFSTLCTLQR